MKMTKPSISTKITGLEKELEFCMYKLQSPNPLEHWSIRAKEIETKLKQLKKKVGSHGKGS
jgi:hypothetical protein